ncbi:MAG: sodium/proton antiporter NhaB [Nitrospinota bacterium]|nr:sodium/proton antiporter NhaB [Nitrospinota bacterium]MDH5755581.1 sodium/proton antiporter NhaB [Nitrospinota bacterium]
MLSAFYANFMGHSPRWYKTVTLVFLVINPILLFTAGPFVAGWVLVMEFIFTLAMALSCYPLLPGGLLALEAIALGMASPENVFEEMVVNFPVILLLMFMVASIYFMRDMLLYIFSNLLVRVHSKIWLSFMFCFAGGFLSAFLDALTVTAVVITAATGFYSVYTKFASSMIEKLRDSQGEKEEFENQYHADLENFRGFLRNIMMHAAVGTALGGVCTLVGEPQNLLIGAKMHWHFGEFFWRMTPITMPTLVAGLLTCALVERFGVAGYGYQLPERVREVLRDYAEKENARQDEGSRAKLLTQALAGVFLIFALAFHIAEVGLIGLAVIIALTSLNGINDEHSIGRAFSEALPFTCLLTVFFAIVAVIHHQGLFAPIVHWTMSKQGNAQLEAFFLASGILSAVSDNVFVATIYITEAYQAHQEGLLSREQLELVAVAINTGTNIPSVATPNGQAAFLFLLTSALAQLIRLSYVRMLILALPYTIVMSLTAYISLRLFL